MKKPKNDLWMIVLFPITFAIILLGTALIVTFL